jgi:hypothetical protein
MLVAPADPSQSPGYPLSTLTYAVTNACTQSAAAVTDYANFLEFATGAGQVSGESIGQLPEGYVPLSGALQARASDSIARLRAPDLQLDCPVIPPIDPGEPPVEPNVDPVDPGFPDLGPTPTEPGQSARNTIVYRTKTELSGSPLLTNLMLSSTFLGLPAFLIGSLSNRRKARTK